MSRGTAGAKAIRVLEYENRSCGVCGTKMGYEQRHREFCSHKCANTAMHRRRGGLACNKACGVCNHVFMAKSAEVYCSTECRIAARTRAFVARSENVRDYTRRMLGHHYRKHITIEYILNMYEAQGGRCAITGDVMTFPSLKGVVNTNMSLDKIDPKGGYMDGNMQLVTTAANFMEARDDHG